MSTPELLEEHRRLLFVAIVEDNLPDVAAWIASNFVYSQETIGAAGSELAFMNFMRRLEIEADSVFTNGQSTPKNFTEIESIAKPKLPATSAPTQKFRML